MEILIIKLGAMGDVLRMTSILRPLKEKYEGARIAWVTKKESEKLLEGNPYVDEIMLIGDAVKKTEGRDFGLVLSFDDEEDACALASGVGSKKIIGAYLKGGKSVYTEDSAFWFDMGLISRYGKAEADRRKAANRRTYQNIHFSILGLKDPTSYPPILVLSEEEKRFAERFAERHGIGKEDGVVGVNTGAGGRWQDKKLSVQQTVELIDSIREKTGAKILLFGGPGEEERNRDILKGAQAGVIDAGCGNSVREFAALVGLCDVLISSDSLAMHIGIALKKSVVAFFYPTSAAEIELYGKGAKIIAGGESYCSYQAVCAHPPEWDIVKMADAAISLL